METKTESTSKNKVTGSKLAWQRMYRDEISGSKLKSLCWRKKKKLKTTLSCICLGDFLSISDVLVAAVLPG